MQLLDHHQIQHGTPSSTRPSGYTVFSHECNSLRYTTVCLAHLKYSLAGLIRLTCVTSECRYNRVNCQCGTGQVLLLAACSRCYTQFFRQLIPAPELRMIKLHHVNKLSATTPQSTRQLKTIWAFELRAFLTFASSLILKCNNFSLVQMYAKYRRTFSCSPSHGAHFSPSPVQSIECFPVVPSGAKKVWTSDTFMCISSFTCAMMYALESE